MRIGFPNFKYTFLHSIIDPMLRRVGFEWGEVGSINDKLRDKLLEMLMKILIAVLDVLELA
jgi:hypothetical protein